jgi:hypothetical protein
MLRRVSATPGVVSLEACPEVGGDAGIEVGRVVSVPEDVHDALRCLHALERSKRNAAARAAQFPGQYRGGRCEVAVIAIVGDERRGRFCDPGECGVVANGPSGAKGGLPTVAPNRLEGRSTFAWLKILAKLRWTTSAWIMERRLVDLTGASWNPTRAWLLRIARLRDASSA